MSTAASVPHVVLLTVPAHGHMNPFTALAHFFAASGISVTLVHSADHTHSLLCSSATTAKVGDPHKQGLIRTEIMPSANASQCLSLDNFRASIPIMCKALEEILQKLMQKDNAPCCLIADGFLSWYHDVALKFGLPRVDVWTNSASVLSIGFHIPELIARGYIPAVDQESLKKTIEFIPGLSPLCVADLPRDMKAEEGLQSPAFELICSIFEHSKTADRMLVNTIYELESDVLKTMRTECGVHMDPVGPLFMMGSISSIQSMHPSLLQEDNSCLDWLDQQAESSVLYISFGTIVAIEEDVFAELAHGLEASGERFLWVIRPDAHKGKAMTSEELLPRGFMQRTRDRGMVISWAPQLAVLAHPSVGAFLTHCGWNSILESLSNGIPMLGFPNQAEQSTNLKLIVHDWKVGLPLVDSDACRVERGHVQMAVNAIMKGVEGAEVRRSAVAWKDIAHKACQGTSKCNLLKLVDDLKYGRLKPGID